MFSRRQIRSTLYHPWNRHSSPRRTVFPPCTVNRSRPWSPRAVCDDEISNPTRKMITAYIGWCSRLGEYISASCSDKTTNTPTLLVSNPNRHVTCASLFCDLLTACKQAAKIWCIHMICAPKAEICSLPYLHHVVFTQTTELHAELTCIRSHNSYCSRAKAREMKRPKRCFRISSASSLVRT